VPPPERPDGRFGHRSGPRIQRRHRRPGRGGMTHFDRERDRLGQCLQRGALRTMSEHKHAFVSGGGPPPIELSSWARAVLLCPVPVCAMPPVDWLGARPPEPLPTPDDLARPRWIPLSRGRGPRGSAAPLRRCVYLRRGSCQPCLAAPRQSAGAWLAQRQPTIRTWQPRRTPAARHRSVLVT
jgi:hypothetical protein